jgi:hypothetical protein
MNLNINNFEQFSEYALRTESILPPDTKVDLRLLKAALLLAINTGKILNIIKKQMFYSYQLKDNDRENLSEWITTIQYGLYPLQEFAKRNNPAPYNPSETTTADLRLIHATIGKITEPAEFAETTLKVIETGEFTDEMRLNLMEEVGDGWWYDAVVMHRFGFTFKEIATRVINKLIARFGGKFSTDKANTRDATAEMAALKQEV